MKYKQKKNNNKTLSDKIADALTLKPRADIEDDEVFGTKPHTVSRADFSSSDSEVETAISDFRKRNINLLSDVSKKYEGKIVSRKDLKEESAGESDDSNIESGQNLSIFSNKDHQNLSEYSEGLETVKRFKELTKLDSDVDEKSSSKNKLHAQGLPKSEDLSNSEAESDSGEESDDYGITQFKKQLANGDPKEDEQSDDDDDDDEDDKDDDDVEDDEDGDDDDDDEDDEDGDDDDDDEDAGEGYDISQMEEPLKEEFKHVRKQNVSEEAKKGACVRNQLLVWESLLEMRIHLQRCMNTANQMPLSDTYNELQQHNEYVEMCNTTKTNVVNVLDKFLNLQSLLLKKFPETKALSTKQKFSDVKVQAKEESDEEIPSDTDNEEIPSDTEPEEDEEDKGDKKSIKKNENPIVVKKRKLEDYEKEIDTSHKAFKTFRDSTIQKWNDKTRLATTANIKNTPVNTILQQISYLLSDREKLLKRTQLKRSEYDIIGYKKHVEDRNDDQNGDANPVTRDRKHSDEYIPEIFDDSDFYHQLLRELIECKSADISDPVQLSRQWIALQQMRSKMKRKVDTKATKGRKIKYVVHNKLVNYMAPEKSTTWNDESTNELYSSLFGKMFEQNNVGLNDNLSSVFKL